MAVCSPSARVWNSHRSRIPITRDLRLCGDRLRRNGDRSRISLPISHRCSMPPTSGRQDGDPAVRIDDYAGHQNDDALLDFIRGSQFQRAQKHRVTEAHEVAVCVDW
jgi:hypothetical protein